MKNQNVMVLILSLIVGLVSETSQAAADRYVCRSMCVVIDEANGSMAPLGSVRGLSEVSTDEGFEVMQQACRNLATSRGLSPATTSMIRGATRISSQHRQAQSESRGQQNSFKLGWGLDFSKSKSSSMSTGSSRESSFGYEVNYADESSCGPLVRHPDGNPKYIGSETPLG
jgi:hypothetical protein